MPAKDYTTGIEVDPNNRYAVASTSVTVTDLSLTESAYIYWDEGIDNFAGDYEFLIKSFMSGGSSTGSQGYGWALANEIGDMYALQNTTPQGSHGFYLLEPGAGVQHVRIIEGTTGGATYIDSYTGAGNATYYSKIIRDESIGAFGTLYCYIYSDAARTILLDTLSIALHENIDFQYLYGANSYNNSGALEAFDATFSELEFVGAAPSVVTGFPFFFGAGHY